MSIFCRFHQLQAARAVRAGGVLREISIPSKHNRSVWKHLCDASSQHTSSTMLWESAWPWSAQWIFRVPLQSQLTAPQPNFIVFKDWGYVLLHEIDFLLKIVNESFYW